MTTQAAILPVYYLNRPDSTATTSSYCGSTATSANTATPGAANSTRCARVLEDKADAAAIGINTWEAIEREELMPGAFELIWQSPTYSHCDFTALPALPDDRTAPWVDQLLAMDFDNLAHRPILQMESLRRWVHPHLESYHSLFEAVKEQKIPLRW